MFKSTKINKLYPVSKRGVRLKIKNLHSRDLYLRAACRKIIMCRKKHGKEEKYGDS